jgi:hypothetical protein
MAGHSSASEWSLGLPMGARSAQVRSTIPSTWSLPVLLVVGGGMIARRTAAGSLGGWETLRAACRPVVRNAPETETGHTDP